MSAAKELWKMYRWKIIVFLVVGLIGFAIAFWGFPLLKIEASVELSILAGLVFGAIITGLIPSEK